MKSEVALAKVLWALHGFFKGLKIENGKVTMTEEQYKNINKFIEENLN